MGKQVNFFMVQSDEEEFLRFATATQDVKLLWRLDLASPHHEAAFPLERSDLPYRSWLVLWNASIVPRDAITPPNRVPDALHSAGRFDVNPYVHPVVEVSRSIERADGLYPGRIWANVGTRRLNPEQRRLFRSWFDHLARWLNHWPYRWNMYRIGPTTKAYFDAGGRAAIVRLGEITSIDDTSGAAVVRRAPRIDSFNPDVECDGGAEDLSIDLRP